MAAHDGLGLGGLGRLGIDRINRRSFLAGCAGCAAGCKILGAAAPLAAAAPAGTASDRPSKIRLLFTHSPANKPTWPHKGFDFEPRKQELARRLQDACPEIQFLPATAVSEEQAQAILEQDREIDGYVVYMVGMGRAPTPIGQSRHPIVLVDDLYGGTGHFLEIGARFAAEGCRVTRVASSRFEDVVEAVRCLDSLRKMRETVVLDVMERRDHSPAIQAIRETLGTEVKLLKADELNQAYESADRTLAREWAERWISGAKLVDGPSREEILKSGALYVGMCDLLRRHGARAITIDCLGLFYAGSLKAYPCMGYFQLNGDGLVGACEADLRSTVTMLLMGYLTGRPGYISDPVIDTATRQVIYAHCVATNRVFGPKGAANPYNIRTHAEDDNGAAVQSFMPIGETVSTLQFDFSQKKVFLHQGKTVGNVSEAKACRSKLAVEVEDIDKLLNVPWHLRGWHRVTFYGDYKRQARHLSALLGFECVEEA